MLIVLSKQGRAVTNWLLQWLYRLARATILRPQHKLLGV
jgi:hypothetical protein